MSLFGYGSKKNYTCRAFYVTAGVSQKHVWNAEESISGFYSVFGLGATKGRCEIVQRLNLIGFFLKERTLD